MHDRMPIGRRTVLLLLPVLLLESPVFGCGPGPEIFIIPFIALIWMVVLIPVELSILKAGGATSWSNALHIYASTIVAKVAGFTLVWYVFAHQIIGSWGKADFIYALTHGLISAAILHRGYRWRGVPLFTTALLISTAIPWGFRWGLILFLEEAFRG